MNAFNATNFFLALIAIFPVTYFVNLAFKRLASTYIQRELPIAYTIVFMATSALFYVLSNVYIYGQVIFTNPEARIIDALSIRDIIGMGMLVIIISLFTYIDRRN